MIIDDFSNPKRKLTVSEASAANDYFTRRKSEEDRIAGIKAPAKNKKNPANTDYAKKRKQQDIEESRPFRGTGGAFNRGDDERHDIDSAREQQLAQYEQSGKFWLKYKDSQKHVNDTAYIGKAAARAAFQDLLRKHPELKGNLVMTAWGPGEQEVTEGEDDDSGTHSGNSPVPYMIQELFKTHGSQMSQYVRTGKIDPAFKEEMKKWVANTPWYDMPSGKPGTPAWHEGAEETLEIVMPHLAKRYWPKWLKMKEYHSPEQGVAEALTYPQKHSSWSVHSPKKNEFNTRYKLDQEPEARAHAERVGGKLVKVDQRGHAIRTGSKGDKGVAEGFNSKQEVIDHFVKQGKSAAAGAMAWERGWRGNTPKKKPLRPPVRSYHDDLDDKRYDVKEAEIIKRMLAIKEELDTLKPKLAKYKISEMSSGGTGAGGISTAPSAGGGSLFGGSYERKDNPFAAPVKKKKANKK